MSLSSFGYCCVVLGEGNELESGCKACKRFTQMRMGRKEETYGSEGDDKEELRGEGGEKSQL